MMMMENSRSREEMDALLFAAKLDREDLLPGSQEIAFSSSFSSSGFKLLELPKEVGMTMEIGNRLVFRGEADEPGVLCTDSCTFEVKEAETSNSLLVFSDLVFPDQVPRRRSSSNDEGDQCQDEEEKVILRKIKNVAHSYLECKKIKPNLSRIRTLLEKNSYKGEESDAEMMMMDVDGEIPSTSSNRNRNPIATMTGVTLESLLDIIPASSGEIQEYLKTIRVVELHGKLRLIDDEYLFRIFSLVASVIEENSWNKDEVPKKEVLTILRSLAPAFVLQKIFEWFFTKKEDSSFYAMKTSEVCKFTGEALLKPVSRFNFKDFMTIWRQSVPEGLKVDLKMLEDIAVVNSDVSPPVIWYFPEYHLPDSPGDRFAVLFDAKPRWKLEDMSPFLANLPSAASIGALLTKFARVSTVNGVKFVTAKHAK